MDGYQQKLQSFDSHATMICTFQNWVYFAMSGLSHIGLYHIPEKAMALT